MFLFTNLILLPLKTPSSLKKVGIIPDILREFVSKFSWLILVLGIFLIIIFSIRIYVTYVKYRSKKIKVLFRTLYSEILLLKYISAFNKTKSKEIKDSMKKTVSEIIPLVEKKFFSSKLSENGYKRILDGLDLIVNDKMEVKDQLKLVDNWIWIVKIS